MPFADTDTLVARAARKPVGDIFVDDGELVFRELERGAVASGLDAVRPAAASSRSAAAPCSTRTSAGCSPAR